MAGAIIEVREQFRCAWLDDRDIDRIAGKRAYGVHRGEAGQSDERDFGAVRTSEDVGIDEARDFAHRREQLIEQEPLVVVRVVGLRPASRLVE